MNPQHLNFNNHNQAAAFHQEKQKWENAISNYQGSDPLELWYDYICWYEQNIHLDHERLFETILGKCLSIYESQHHYKQDTRFVKLWMKYIGLKSNPLNLYQVLYQRGIGTQCSIFYIGWAHYYDAANAFKQAESVYNLGFQANAQPYSALERSHKDFRFSISQRMLYNDQQTKKRTVSQLNDQRQQLTSLNPSSTPPAVPNFQHAKSNYTPQTPMAQQQQQQSSAYAPPEQQQQQQSTQQSPQQPPQQVHHHQPPQQQPTPSQSQSQPTYNSQQPAQNYQNYTQSGEQEHQPPAKKFRGPDEPRASTYNRNFNDGPVPPPAAPHTIARTEYNAKAQSQYNDQYFKMGETKEICDDLTNSTSAACAIASSLNSVYSGDEDGSDDYGYTMYNRTTTAPASSTGYRNGSTATYSTTTVTTTNTSSTSTATATDQSSLPGACILPANFARSAKNHYNAWHWPIFLDEPDTNKICKYPRHLVYPGNGCEYSLEEIRARNYAKMIETIKERTRQREMVSNEQAQYNHVQEQMMSEYNDQQAYERQRQAEIERQRQAEIERQRLAEVERQRQAEVERERVMKERERNRLAALEMKRAKEQEQQQLQQQQQQRLEEQQKMQQMQEQAAYHHQQPKQCHPQPPNQQAVANHNHANYYEPNQPPVHNNYANYSAQQYAPVPYQSNGSPVPYQSPHHQNSSPHHYQQNHPNSSPYPQSHQSSTPVPYQQSHHQNPIMPYQQMQPQTQPQAQPPQQQQVAPVHQPYYSPNHIAPTQPQTAAMHFAPPLDSQNDMYRAAQARYMPQQVIPSHLHQHHHQHQHHQPYSSHVAPHQQQQQPSPLHMHMQYEGSYQSTPPYAQSQPQSQYPSQAPTHQQQHQFQPPQMSHAYAHPSQVNHSDYPYELQPPQTAVPAPTPASDVNNVQSAFEDRVASVSETKTINSYADDIEEQIEASTIVLKNGSDKLQKITIKYRREKVDCIGGDSNQSAATTSTPIPKSKVQKEKKPKKQKARSCMMPTSLESESENSTFLENDDQFSESNTNDSFSTPVRINKSSKSKKTAKSKLSKLEATYDSDSCSNSDFTKLYGKYSNEGNDGAATESGRNVRFNFTGATSTPIRNNNNINNYQSSPCSSAKPSYKSNESSSKSSTPRNTYKSLRRRTSNTSLMNSGMGGTLIDNDDSLTSFSMVEPNSFFEAESNDELNQQRLDKALKTIDIHLKKEFIDPFNQELCKAFLTKANFPSREHNEFYKLSNTLLAKLSNTKSVTIGDTRFNVEKEIGRGAYGSVYRGINTNSGDTVALKYQKPPNTWELYICFEVQQRIKDPNLLMGYMDISSAIISPNASIFITEFSQFGSLLDINNRIRQSTTKVMHESLVMHFTSQILKIVHYLHSGKIIHGDIKPDNFLLMKIPNPNSGVPTLRLIDFGCAIDMKFFEPKTQFKKVIQTDGFTCPEMLEGRVWSYQTDIFCVAGTVHVMLFGEYMQMVKKFGQYEIKQKLPRYLKKHIWTEFFSTFLNIKDANHLPNLLKMKTKIDNELDGMESELQSQIRTLSNILYKR